MNFFKEIIWRLYLQFFIPKNLWYYDRSNNTVIVVPARMMEGRFRLYNARAIPGMRLERVPSHGNGYIDRGHLIFSDHLAYMNGREVRASDGVAGDLSDFDRFRHRFPVQQRAIFIPAASTLRNEGLLMGHMNNPDDFYNVLRYAEEFCQ